MPETPYLSHLSFADLAAMHKLAKSNVQEWRRIIQDEDTGDMDEARRRLAYWTRVASYLLERQHFLVRQNFGHPD